MENTNRMETMPIGKLMLSMSLPMMASLLIQSLYNIVDSIFVARLSESALTAASLAYPVQMLMIAVGVGTAVGVNALLSRTLGQKNYEEASRIAVSGILLALMSSVVFIVIGLFFAGKIADSFAADPEISAMCRSYLWINMVFCLGNIECMVLQRLLQASGRAALSMCILVSGAVANLILDPIMIFGLLGCPAMGIKGAALATVIGQFVSMIIGILLNIRHNPEVRLTLKGYRMEKKTIAGIYRVGIPTIIMQAMNSFMVTAFNAILLPFSPTAVAFFGIYYKLQSFLFMPMNGLGQAAIPVIGYNYGAKRFDRIRETSRISEIAAICMAIVGTCVFLIFPKQLLVIFSASDAMLGIGVRALRIIAISFPAAACTMIFGYLCSGFGDGLTNMVSSILRQFFPLIPAAWLLARFNGISVVWYAIWISEICGMVYACFRMRKRFNTIS